MYRVIYLPLVEANGLMPTKARNGEPYLDTDGVLFYKKSDGSVINVVEAALTKFGSGVGSDKPLNFGDNGESRIHYDSSVGTFAIMNQTNGGDIVLKSKKADGTEARMLHASGDGELRLFHPATDKMVFTTLSNGVRVLNPNDSTNYLSQTFNGTTAFLNASKRLVVNSNDDIAFITDQDGASKQFTMTAAGDLRVQGNVIAFYSDKRLKTNFQPIGAALHKVGQLNGQFYNPSEKAVELGLDTADSQHVGLIAQEVRDVLPEAVTDIGIEAGIGDMYLTVKYEKIVPLLVEAIKELKAELDEVKRVVIEG